MIESAVEFLVSKNIDLKETYRPYVVEMINKAFYIEEKNLITAMVECQIVDHFNYDDGSIIFVNTPKKYFRDNFVIVKK